jgi:hypothetical protein
MNNFIITQPSIMQALGQGCATRQEMLQRMGLELGGLSNAVIRRMHSYITVLLKAGVIVESTDEDGETLYALAMTQQLRLSEEDRAVFERIAKALEHRAGMVIGNG